MSKDVRWFKMKSQQWHEHFRALFCAFLEGLAVLHLSYNERRKGRVVVVVFRLLKEGAILVAIRKKKDCFDFFGFCRRSCALFDNIERTCFSGMDVGACCLISRKS